MEATSSSPYRDYWITLSVGHHLRGRLTAGDGDGPRDDLVSPDVEGFDFFKKAAALGIISVTPVVRDELLESYEQLVLGLDVISEEGRFLSDPEEAREHANAILARYSSEHRISGPDEDFLTLDNLRDTLPMMHPYYRVRVDASRSQRFRRAIQKADEIKHVVDAPRLVRDAWPPQDRLIRGLNPTFDGTAIQLYPEDWQPKLREQWNLAAIGVPSAWQALKASVGEKNPYASGVTVAIIDSGIEFSHPDLRGAEAAGSDACILPRPDGPDPDPHGTLVAGIIGARSNERGICGIAPECTLLSLVHGGKPITTPTPPAGMEIDVSERIEAIVRAIRSGADVINLSWHVERTCCDSDAHFQRQLHGPLLDAILLATIKKVPVVCSTGNRSHLSYPTPYISYPAAYDGLRYKGVRLQVISVGAVDHNRKRLSGSNYVPRHDSLIQRNDHAQWPTLMAPGYSVPTTDFEDRPGLSRGCYIKLNVLGVAFSWPFGWVPDYAPFSGTSAAAPHVTGVIALMLSRLGARTVEVEKIKEYLVDHATDISTENPGAPPESLGAGLLNARDVLKAITP